MSMRRAHHRHSFIAAVFLAAGVGATAAVYTVGRTLSPAGLPYPAADRLMVAQAGSRSWSPAMLEAVASTSSVFDAVAGIQERATTAVAAQAQVVRLETVSASYFAMLGVTPARGRVFTPSEDRRGTAISVAVISDGLWRRQFGGDLAVIGRPIEVDGTASASESAAPTCSRIVEVNRIIATR